MLPDSRLGVGAAGLAFVVEFAYWSDESGRAVLCVGKGSDLVSVNSDHRGQVVGHSR